MAIPSFSETDNNQEVELLEKLNQSQCNNRFIHEGARRF